MPILTRIYGEDGHEKFCDWKVEPELEKVGNHWFSLWNSEKGGKGALSPPALSSGPALSAAGWSAACWGNGEQHRINITSNHRTWTHTHARVDSFTFLYLLFSMRWTKSSSCSLLRGSSALALPWLFCRRSELCSGAAVAEREGGFTSHAPVFLRLFWLYCMCCCYLFVELNKSTSGVNVIQHVIPVTTPPLL